VIVAGVTVRMGVAVRVGRAVVRELVRVVGHGRPYVSPAGRPINPRRGRRGFRRVVWPRRDAPTIP
jgi:hypothetical protein